MVVGSIFGSQRTIEVALGLILAIAVICDTLWRSRRRFRRRHPDLVNRWCAVPRGVRKSIRKDIRDGRPIPVDHAPLAIESIDLARKLRRAQKLNRRNRARWSIGPACGTLVLSGLLITIGDPPVVAGALTMASFSAIWMGVAAAALIHAWHWDRYWPPRLIASRAQAERALAPAVRPRVPPSAD